MDAISSKLEILNLKFDKIIYLLENKNGNSIKVNEKKSRKKYVKPEEVGSDWSMEFHKNSIVIKFSYNDAFKEYIKELGGKWNVSLRGWVFSKDMNDEIYESISAKFEDWVFTDNRTNIN